VKVSETAIVIFLCRWIWRTGKATGHIYVLVEGMSRNKFFFSFEYITCFTFYIHLWPVYWVSLVSLTPSRNRTTICQSSSLVIVPTDLSRLPWSG
jgi:hypothetical protein